MLLQLVKPRRRLRLAVKRDGDLFSQKMLRFQRLFANHACPFGLFAVVLKGGVEVYRIC